MNVTALLLADSRFPGGSHAHSGGVEEAAARGLLSTEDELLTFLLGRLRTAGSLAAVFAAAAAHAVRREVGPNFWIALDAELDARTPSPAQREASRAQGSGVRRAMQDSFLSLSARKEFMARPHHPIALGAVIGVTGGGPLDAGVAAAYLSVSGPATAAVRLLGLDPLVANGIIAGLGPEIMGVADKAAGVAGLDPAELPAPGAPGLDLLAEAHERAEVRLFAS